ncbi:SDR family oxidoreductase [Arthrobacter sp. ISL-69]|uniref:SDR family oxidoreductase n=1 Tax=Arthrobacter sp. ISL-69 TaxID=2819113 RepID=UPI001BE7F653|nr:NAD(P)H-binding protein [Arthrobacter sp. ISL-69]MBT2537183.1 NAD(P)H-binding protein [Arthrobacter sp. ISL-69]
MTHICVAGGTGQVGREVVRQALTLGHEVSVISRNPPASGRSVDNDGATYFRADVTAGNGLSAALAGAAVVIDCLEGKSGRALRNFADGGTRLLRAAHAAGVRKAVLLSIINCDKVPLRFYRSKADKEDVYAGSLLETVTVRTTQFHSLPVQLFAAGAKVGLIPVIKGARFQTIAPAEVATALLEAALEEPAQELHRLRTMGGPEVIAMGDLAEAWKRHTGSWGRLLHLPLPGAMGKFLREGRNLVPEQRYGSETFGSWLAKHADSL